jgi:hypothetical protein
VQLEGLGVLKKSNGLIWIQTRDLLACIVPQPTNPNGTQIQVVTELWK